MEQFFSFMCKKGQRE